MLPNRVTPCGDIIITAARGAWMGNRGQLHNAGKTILRPYKLKAWITCLLEFKGWKRPVMAPNKYTELFFLDEATAFAAGHRPCCECRRADFNRFKHSWLSGNSVAGFSIKTSVTEIDAILHRERMGMDGGKITYTADTEELPDGTFIKIEDRSYLVAGKMLYGWTPEGYDEPIPMPLQTKVEVLTPRSVVNAFDAGYTPQMAVVTA